LRGRCPKKRGRPGFLYRAPAKERRRPGFLRDLPGFLRGRCPKKPEASSFLRGGCSKKRGTSRSPTRPSRLCARRVALSARGLDDVAAGATRDGGLPTWASPGSR
jgi:hypothetical protein